MHMGHGQEACITCLPGQLHIPRTHACIWSRWAGTHFAEGTEGAAVDDKNTRAGGRGVGQELQHPTAHLRCMQQWQW